MPLIILLALMLFSAGAYAQDATPTVTPYHVDCKSDTETPGCVVAPKPIHQPDPHYTKAARKAKIEGTTVIWIVVGPDGLVQKAKIQKSLDLGLDEEALKTVKKWKFKPATRDGKPVPVAISVEINFHLY